MNDQQKESILDTIVDKNKLAESLKKMRDNEIPRLIPAGPPLPEEQTKGNAITLPMSEWRELTGEDIQEAVRQVQLREQGRIIQLIRDQARVYLPGYILDKLIQDIEKGE